MFFLLHAYAFQVFVVPTASMAPTLRPEDAVLVNRLSYEFAPPRRGDLIVFHYPQAAGRSFLKRVVGVPGDTIEERNGRFWVNGTPLRPWLNAQADTQGAGTPLSMPPLRVPTDQFFVLGDNPVTSLDSRFWGTVNIHEVVGKALLILWSHGAHWWDVRWHRIGRWLP